MSDDYGDKGRRVQCPCCRRRHTVRPRDVWQSKAMPGARLRIVSAEKDGAIAEQIGREDVDPRWGISYHDLQRDYYRVRSEAPDER
jgi:hypothetical protein